MRRARITQMHKRRHTKKKDSQTDRQEIEDKWVQKAGYAVESSSFSSRHR